MVRTMKAGLACTALAGAFSLQPSLRAQDNMKQGSMKTDDAKHDKLQDSKMAREDTAKTLFTGQFYGKAHNTSGLATVYQEADGKLVLRLTNFKTSSGPDVHVILAATKEGNDDVKGKTEKVELGKLKGKEGDQNYEIPAGTDLTKFRTVSIYCKLFHANFGAATLKKFSGEK